MEKIFISCISCIFFVLLTEFIIPEGKYNKSVKTVIAIIFISAMFLPIFKLFTSENYDEVFGRNELFIDSIKQNNMQQKTQYIYNISLIEDYKSRLKEALIKEFNDKGIEFNGNIRFEINEDEDISAYGEIKAVYIDSAKVNSSKILKKIINDFYKLSEDNIYITEVAAHEN